MDLCVLIVSDYPLSLSQLLHRCWLTLRFSQAVKPRSTQISAATATSLFSAHLQPSFVIRNYMLGVHVLHKQLGWEAQTLDIFPVICLLRAEDLNIVKQPLMCLLILPTLLHQLCLLADSLGQLGLPMNVCLNFGFLGMLCQSNLAPRSTRSFDPSRHI